jgi:hypothetical protein
MFISHRILRDVQRGRSRAVTAVRRKWRAAYPKKILDHLHHGKKNRRIVKVSKYSIMVLIFELGNCRSLSPVLCA